MPKTRPPYATGIRRPIGELVRAGEIRPKVPGVRIPTRKVDQPWRWWRSPDRQEGRREESAKRVSAAEREELAPAARERTSQCG